MQTIREATAGIATVRLLKDKDIFKGIVIIKGQVEAHEEGEHADDVWRRLHDRAARLNPSFFGFDGARARFLRFFPEGFQSSNYFKEERGYKLAAKERLDKTVPIDKALNGSGYGEAVLSIFRETNLLFPVEKTRLQDVLRGPTADQFIRAAAKFAMGEIKAGIAEMERVLKPHVIAKWTAVTYLPFLWRPDAHMFLKPTVTTEFASRVGHRFANEYSPMLDAAVYDCWTSHLQRRKRSRTLSPGITSTSKVSFGPWANMWNRISCPTSLRPTQKARAAGAAVAARV